MQPLVIRVIAFTVQQPPCFSWVSLKSMQDLLAIGHGQNGGSFVPGLCIPRKSLSHSKEEVSQVELSLGCKRSEWTSKPTHAPWNSAVEVCRGSRGGMVRVFHRLIGS